MGRFIRNFFAFFGLNIIIFLGFNLLLIKSRDNYLRLPLSINKAFLGNSTIEYAVDDSRIAGAINFAQNGEPIDILYAKLKLLIRNNPQIDTIFVELDDIILYNQSLIPVVSNAIYLDCYDMDDWINNFRNQDFDRLTKYVSHCYDIIKIRPFLTNHSASAHNLKEMGVGGFAKLYRNKLGEDISRHLEKPNDRIKEIPASNIYYFDKIVKTARSKNVEIIFINTPKHRIIWSEDNYIRFWRNRFKDIQLADFSRIMMPDSCFGDASHLNHIGASQFSDTLQNYLNQL